MIIVLQSISLDGSLLYNLMLLILFQHITVLKIILKCSPSLLFSALTTQAHYFAPIDTPNCTILTTG